MVRVLVLLFSTLFFTLSTYAQEVKFYSEITPKEGSEDDTYIYSVVIEGTQASDFPTLEGGSGFKLSYIGPENSVSIINGHTSMKTRYRYLLAPKKPGLLETPTAELNLNGKSYLAPPKRVRVSKSVAIDESSNAEVFLRQSLSAHEVFEGQQVVNTLALYTKVDISGYNLEDIDYDGFWKAEFGDPSATIRNVNGKRYKVISRKDALYPLRAGDLSMPERIVEGKIAARSRMSRFSLFPQVQYKSGKWRAPGIPLKVKALPEAPKSSSLWNLNTPIVGNTSVSATYKPTPIAVGESKTIQIRVKSEGNINPLLAPKVKFPRHIKPYFEKPEVVTSVTNGKLIISKTFALSLVGLSGGEVNIPEIELTFFDPKSEKYQTAKSEAISFFVTGPVDTAEKQDTKESPTAVIDEETNEKLPAYTEKSKLEKLSERISLSLSLLIITAIIIIFLAAIFFTRAIRKKSPIKKLIQNIEQARSAEQLGVAFKAFLSAKLPAIKPESSGEALRAEIKRALKQSDRAFAVQNAVDSIEKFLYSGEANSSKFESLRVKVLNVVRDWQ